MTITTAIFVLKRHNMWRRGANINMQDPEELGKAIDKLIQVSESKKEIRGRKMTKEAYKKANKMNYEEFKEFWNSKI